MNAAGARDPDAAPPACGRREPGSEGEDHLPSKGESHALESSLLAPELFDPMARVLAAPGMRPALTPAESTSSTTVTLPPDFEKLVTRLVRRVAFGGDGRRGSARIEIGEGELAGATIVIHAEAREVRVEVDLPPGVAAEGWRRRIERRLEDRGLSIRELVVR